MKRLLLVLVAVCVVAGLSCDTDTPHQVKASQATLRGWVEAEEIPDGWSACYRFVLSSPGDNTFTDPVTYVPATAGGSGPWASTYTDGTGRPFGNTVTGLEAETLYYYKLEFRYITGTVPTQDECTEATEAWDTGETIQSFTTDKLLKWAPPTISEGTPQTINVTTAGGEWTKSTSDDCTVNLPGSAVTSQIRINGCHDIRLIGGEVNHTGSVAAAPAPVQYGIWLNNWSGTAHIEGVRLRGSGLSDGLWTSSSTDGSTVQIENVRVDEVHGPYTEPLSACSPAPADPHPDVLQLFEGPTNLKIDRLTGKTNYQGIYLNHSASGSNDLDSVEMRDVEIDVLNGKCGGFSLFDTDSINDVPSQDYENVTVDDNGRGQNYLTVGPTAALTAGWFVSDNDDISWVSAISEKVPDTKAGIGYFSPGYEP